MEVFSFREDWHQEGRADPLIRQYQLTLDAILRKRADLQDCAVRCCHCKIRFLTHPRNAGRQDLRCPFGCRQHHRRQSANERSRDHYRTDSAKRKKKRLNGQRCKLGNDTGNSALSDAHSMSASLEQAPAQEPAGALGMRSAGVNCSGVESASESVASGATGKTPAEIATAEIVGLPLAGFVLDERALVNSSILPYARMVASMIEGRTISREELLAVLRKRMRQHSIGRLSRREYVLRYLIFHPP